MIKKVIIVLIMTILLTSIITIQSQAKNILESKAETPSPLDYTDYTYDGGVIQIESDDEFINHPAVTPGGKGTQNQPYIIENWRVKQIIIKQTASYFEINNCYIYGGYAIYFYRVENSKIQNCVIEKDKGYTGIELKWSYNNIIDDCRISNYFNAFILTFSSSNNIIKNCQITDTSHQNEGFAILGSSNNEIYNCEIQDFDTYGFRLEDSNNNKIHHNTMQNAGWYGVYLYNSNYNDIYCCQLTNCLIGAYLEGCIDNNIYYNDIYNNEERNAFVTITGRNNWDNGQEGNYWGDYSGEDADKSGIGDEEYKISNDEQDNYPLMQKYDTPFPPRVTGRSEGWITKAYDYKFITTDHSNDKVYYYVDWDDGSEKQWYGPYKSGEEIPITHIYDRYGNYRIKAKARDINGFESDWGAEFMLTMAKDQSKTKATRLNRLIDFFQICNLREIFFKILFS